MLRNGQLLQILGAVCFLALMVMSYIDLVYLPQKKMLDEQQESISSLVQEIQALRGSRDKGEEQALHEQDREEHARFKLQVHELEKALRKLGAEVPDLAKLGVTSPPSTASSKKKLPEEKKPQNKGSDSDKTKSTAVEQKWRSDNKCGAQNRLPNGMPSGCNPRGEFPCCSPGGWCGVSSEHCQCEGCVDSRLGNQITPGNYDESSAKAIAIVIPFRDRAMHLEYFRERLDSHVQAWDKRGIHHTWVLFVVEQFDNELFNRGWLFNVGFHYAMEYAKEHKFDFDCVVMQDIDNLPTPEVDYGWCQWPVQLSGEIECWNWAVPYMDNVGGVVSMSPAHWRQINGFSNQYEGWGGEDDDLYLRLKQTSMLKGGCHTFCNERSRVPMVFRPPLGRGRFTCLDDEHHTPRQRAHDDGAMWGRLNQMKSNSQRWRQDGISDLTMNVAGHVVVSAACPDGCAAPEDPAKRKRVFAEHWSRVSRKPVHSPDRIDVILPEGHPCAGLSRPLDKVPSGITEFRQLIPKLFEGANGNDTDRCGLHEKWAASANFVLVDIVLGQSLMVGYGCPSVVADNSLPPLGSAKKKQLVPTESLVQSQRLGRWIRRLPESHRGWAIVMDKPLKDVRQQFVDSERRVKQVSPVCISYASFSSGKKYRARAGTTWCGDGGWTSSEHFTVLRSKTSVPEDKVFPVCIAYNTNHYTFRFENSETGCVGHEKTSGAEWVHSATFHTSRDADGEPICVGVQWSGPTTRWMMRKAERCDSGGYEHYFGFRAMSAKYESPLSPACIASAKAKGDNHVVQRLAATADCSKLPLEEGYSPWRHERSLTVLAARQAVTDRMFCLGEALITVPDGSAKIKVWQAFFGSEICEQSTHTSAGPAGGDSLWRLTSTLHFVPGHEAGPRLCQCIGKSRSQIWREVQCEAGEQKVESSCFYTLSTASALAASNLLDEVV